MTTGDSPRRYDQPGRDHDILYPLLLAGAALLIVFNVIGIAFVTGVMPVGKSDGAVPAQRAAIPSPAGDQSRPPQDAVSTQRSDALSAGR